MARVLHKPVFSPPSASDERITRVCRLGALAFGVWALLVDPLGADAAVAGLWVACVRSGVFWLEGFEPLFASACFFVWINAWRFVDAWCSRGSSWRVGEQAGRAPPRSKYVFWGGVRIGLAGSASYGVAALLAYLAPLLLFHAVWPRARASKMLTCAAAPSCCELLRQLLASLLVYDGLHWPLHLAQHTRAASPGWRLHRLLANSHATHHSGVRPLRAGETVRHSLLDGALQVACNVAALNLVGSHPLARLLHNAVVTALLTEAHCGFDAPWMAHRVLPWGWLGGSARHEAHHRDPAGTAHHQQLFTYLDEARRAVLSELQRRAVAAR